MQQGNESGIAPRGDDDIAVPARGQQGYSLTELVIVITILAVIAAIAVPSFPTNDPSKVDLAGAEFAEAIRYARNEAIRSGEPRGFYHDSAQKRIRLFRLETSGSPATLLYDVYHPITKQLYDVALDEHSFASANTTVQSVMHRGTCNVADKVYFDQNGTPWCTDPENILLEQYELTLALGPWARVVTVHGVTGRVTVQ